MYPSEVTFNIKKNIMAIPNIKKNNYFLGQKNHNFNNFIYKNLDRKDGNCLYLTSDSLYSHSPNLLYLDLIHKRVFESYHT